ncbi:TonB-dependent receptor [Sphingopyxis sp. C-1]|uniref:TonB-dependent receptor n=1 Tax=Sphingopyxis sp. C-1 TaxID=262667 RepID=UPI0006C4FFDE|nr:TonB-dependent receptor [Sphingopyxis sp. C-1]GAO77474.1 outer membrane receptor proteins, mostly Fe transport [Sphingopyxis sp. C-1]
MKVAFLLSSSLAALLLGAPANAQDTGALGEAKDQGDGAQAVGDTAAAGDIIVTAQRREQRLQDAPVAVTALGSAALDQQNVLTTRDLMQVVPSLQVSTSANAGGGAATFFLRGMGQLQSSNGAEPAVGVYVDDLYYPSLQGAIFDVVELAQVEVLRGPQGTLFGRNTIAGAIRYTTRGPDVSKFEARVTGRIGSYDRREISGSVNLPIADAAAVRLTAGHLERDGFVDIQSSGGKAGGSKTDLVRGQVRIEPTNSTYIEASAQYSKFELDGIPYNIPGPMTPVAPRPGASPTQPLVYNNTVAPARGLPLYTDAYRSTCYYCQFGTNNPEFADVRYKNALVRAGWNFADGFELKSITGWQDTFTRRSSDQDSTPLPVNGGALNREKILAFSQELQLNGRLLDNRLNFVSGLFYYNERQPAMTPERPNTVLGNPVVVANIGSRYLKSYAGYIDGSFEIVDDLLLLGGIRYSKDKKRIVQTNTATGAEIASGDRSFGSTTYRAGIQYSWTPDIMTYFNVATGFRAGGFNPFSATNTPRFQPFEPEKATSYEVGARFQFLDRRITFNPTAFYVDWTKIQVQAIGTDEGGQVVRALQNAGAARSYGFELEWAAMVTDTLRLSGNFAYLDVRYTDVGNATGITVESDLQRAPPITFSIAAAHTLKLDSGAKLVASVNFSFNDEQRSTATDADTLILDAYGLVNARIEYTDPSGRYSIAPYVTNLFDKKYAVGGVNFYANVGAARYDLGRPREFGVTLRAVY